MAVKMNHWTRRQFIKLSSAAAFQLMMSPGLSFAGNNVNSHLQIEREKRMQNSPQYKDGEFVNPIDVPMMAPGSTWTYIKKSFFSKRLDPKPTGELPVKSIRRNDWADIDKNNLFFTWLGHSSIMIAMDGKTVLVDPVLEERASPFT